MDFDNERWLAHDTSQQTSLQFPRGVVGFWRRNGFPFSAGFFALRKIASAMPSGKDVTNENANRTQVLEDARCELNHECKVPSVEISKLWPHDPSA